ncbi:TPA: transcriptional regulator [Serratia fonticola]|nr:transcriptional regulator [Serratia fonticola]
MNRTCWRILKNSEEHALAMARLIELASGDLQPGTDDFDELELLGLLIEHYEGQKYPMDKPDPIEAIKFRMDQQGLSQADMKQYIGSASKVSEVLNRKRPLSLSMIRRIHDGLGIPADILIQDMSAIEWSLVDADETDVTVTAHIPMFEAESALFMTETAMGMGCFSGKITEKYVSTTMQEVDLKATGRTDISINDIDNFLIIKESSSSLTASAAKFFEMNTDRNYTLVS